MTGQSQLHKISHVITQSVTALIYLSLCIFGLLALVAL